MWSVLWVHWSYFIDIQTRVATHIGMQLWLNTVCYDCLNLNLYCLLLLLLELSPLYWTQINMKGLTEASLGSDQRLHNLSGTIPLIQFITSLADETSHLQNISSNKACIQCCSGYLTHLTHLSWQHLTQNYCPNRKKCFRAICSMSTQSKGPG